MSPVHKLSQMGSLTTNKTDYPSMLAGYGDFGALQRIATITPDATGSEVYAFSNIPQNFQDLVVVISALNTNNGGAANLAFDAWNGTTTANRSSTVLRGDGSSATSFRATNSDNITAMTGLSTTAPTSLVMHILNYANSSTFKTVLIRSANDKNGSGETRLMVGTIASTSPISYFVITSQVVNSKWTSGSRFSLYGVRASAA